MCYQAHIVLIAVHRPRQGHCASRSALPREARSHRHLSRAEGLRDDRPSVQSALSGPLRNSGQPVARLLHVVAARPVGSRRRCIHVPAQGRECASPGRLHPSATLGGVLSTGDSGSTRPQLAGSMEAGSQPASPRTPSPAPELPDQERKLDPPSLESDMFQDLRVVLEALGRAEGFIDSVLRYQLKSTYWSQWKHRTSWCLEGCRHPWVSLDPNQVSADSARDQLGTSLVTSSQACNRTTTSATTSRRSLLHSSESSASI